MTFPWPTTRSSEPARRRLSLLALAAILLAAVDVPFALQGLWISAAVPLGLGAHAFARSRARGLHGAALAAGAVVVALGAGAYGYLDAHTVRDLGARVGRRVLLAAQAPDLGELEAWLTPPARESGAPARIRERFGRLEAEHGPWGGATRVAAPLLGSASLLLPPDARGNAVVDLDGGPPGREAALWVAARFGEEEVQVALVLADGVGPTLSELRRILVARGRPAPVLADVGFFRARPPREAARGGPAPAGP